MADDIDEFDEIMNREMVRRREFLQEHYGERCRSHDPRCCLCRVWKNQDEWEKITGDDR
jgi:hypothetical protein